MTEYAELHLHTAYSFLDGASLPEELVARATELRYRHLAITDHDGLYGAMEFARAARSAGIAPITGAEVTLLDGSHLTLLVESPAGYSNLSRLLTAAHAPDPKGPWPTTPDERAPRLDPTLLPEHAEGLILLTGCPQGRLSRLVDAGDAAAAEALLQDYIAWFGRKSLYVELQHNRVYGSAPRIAKLAGLAERLRLPIVATGNVHYHRPERHRLQDVLVAIQHRSSLDATHRQRRPNAEFHLRSAAEMAHLFARYPQAVRESIRLAERCAAFDLSQHLPYRFPDYPTPNGETPDEHLADVCREAFVRRYPRDHRWRTEAGRRTAEELTLIKRHGLAGFFLLHREILSVSEAVAAEVRIEQGRPAASTLPPGRGRGSSVSSVVCYLTGLSPVDPLAHNLSLGRFLNEERASPPDIDLDFPREIRARLMERIYAVYPDRAGLIAAFSTYRLRSAVRDVGKALGLPQADLDRIARLSEPTSADALGDQLADLPEYAARLGEPPWCYLVDLAGELSGHPRHITQHSGGMVVASRPIRDLVPLQPAAMPGRWLLQWDKDSVDDAGMVKIDFLALGMLSLVEECVQLIAEHHPECDPPDLTRINFGDTRVFDMICQGDTLGTFQIESRAQIQTLLKTQPRSLDDLTVQVAIVRPGPIVGGATSPYIQRRIDPHFRVTYDHPLLEPVLRETLGVVLYQDQVIEVAMTLAGFSAGEADQLRRAMTRKRSREAMVALWRAFRDGATGNGVAPKTAKEVFQKLLGFAAYGFPKGHAASFAVLAYQSAWLKHYFPAEFLAALLNNQPMGFYPTHVLSNEARRRGVRVLPPDVNQSGVRCTVAGQAAVRLGLAHVRGLGAEVAAAIVAERATHGPYRTLADLVRRAPIRRDAVEALALVGTFDAFGLGRREAVWQAGLFIPPRPFGARRGRAGARGRQVPLALPVAQDQVALRPLPAWERMSAEYQGLGLSPHWHPLGLLRPDLSTTWVTTADLERLPHGTRVTLAGLVVCRQRPETAKGVTFLLVEDETGLVNVIVSRSLYAAQRRFVRGTPFLVIRGRLDKRHGTINLVAAGLGELEAIPAALRPPADEPTEGGVSAPGQVAADPSQRTVAPTAHNYR